MQQYKLEYNPDTYKTVRQQLNHWTSRKRKKTVVITGKNNFHDKIQKFLEVAGI